jgi:hypothetical protein
MDKDLPSSRKRKAPNLSEKLASALLTICRMGASGKLEYVIHPEEAKTLDAKSIIARYEFDHVVLHCFGGSNHPSNLVPRPKPEHREKSRRDTSIAAKDKRITPAQAEFQRKMLSKAGVETNEPGPVKKTKAKIKSQGFRGSRKFNGEITWKTK